MPISRARPPEGLERSVLETAAELLPGRLGDAGARGPMPTGEARELAADTMVSDVWPLYHLGLNRIVDGTGLSAAEMIGWRALLRVNGRSVALADVNAEAAEASDVRQLTYGPVVAGLAAIAQSARQASEYDSDDIEERILQIPGIYVLAIWEHHPANDAADIVVPSAPVPTGLEADRRYPAAELLEAVMPLARDRIDDRSTRGPETAPAPSY